MSDSRLLAGFVAFAVAGVLAVVGGESDSWVLSLSYVAVACGLAVVAIMLLTKFQKKKTIEATVNLEYRELIDVLGVTNETFVRFYSPLVEQISPSTLAFAIRVVKRRRGVVLGSEKGQESVRRNRDRWTYAVFLAAISGVTRLAEDRKTGMELLLFRTPKVAREWLYREDLVVKTLVDVLTLPDDTNPITRLLDGTGKKNPMSFLAHGYEETKDVDEGVAGEKHNGILAPTSSDRVNTAETMDTEPSAKTRVGGFAGQFATKSTVS